MIKGLEYSDERDSDIRDLLQSVFSGQQGTRALDLILRWLGFYDIAIERPGMSLQEAVARRNFAIELLERMGVFHDENTEEIAKKLTEIQPKPFRQTGVDQNE